MTPAPLSAGKARVRGWRRRFPGLELPRVGAGQFSEAQHFKPTFVLGDGIAMHRDSVSVRAALPAAAVAVAAQPRTAAAADAPCGRAWAPRKGSHAK